MRAVVVVGSPAVGWAEIGLGLVREEAFVELENWLCRAPEEAA